MTELGPFRVNSDGKSLWLNQYAWNNVANILFSESPAGVGFSYSNTSLDYVTGDEKTKQDSFTFLINWMEKFPEYKHREFYIVGESYAGHYVPQLAQMILSLKKTEPNLVINLQEIATGNALIDDETRSTGSYDFYWTHALISDEVHEGIVLNCNFSAETTSEACSEYINQAVSCRGNIDNYDIYAPLCYPQANISLPNPGKVLLEVCTSHAPPYNPLHLTTVEILKNTEVREKCNHALKFFDFWIRPMHKRICRFLNTAEVQEALMSEECPENGFLAIHLYMQVGKIHPTQFYQFIKSLCKVELEFGFIAAAEIQIT